MIDDPGFVEGLLARVQGPMSFRFILQPLVAVVFGFRDGRRDAAQGRAANFWGLFTDPVHRREMLANGWHSIGNVFLISIVLDVVFQLIVPGGVRPMGALLAGAILALIPYLLLRGPVNRLSRKATREMTS